jgi:hypothetical protein
MNSWMSKVIKFTLFCATVGLGMLTFYLLEKMDIIVLPNECEIIIFRF